MIGKVYTNNEKDRADPTFIENGWITGEGLLGALVEVIHRLVAASERRGYYRNDTIRLVDAVNEQEAAWRELFVALKTLEDAGKPGL